MSIDRTTPAPDAPLGRNGTVLELESFLPYQLNVLAEGVSRSLSKLYGQRYGISVPEWRVIATLGQYRRMTAKQIGAHSRMHKTKVSRAVAALERQGRVRRTANDSDKREAFLTLTAEGRRVYESVAPEAHAFARQLTSVLSSADADALERILAQLRTRSEDLAVLNGHERDGFTTPGPPR
jgi:DNA-binding MarR family transcriptional regulator